MRHISVIVIDLALRAAICGKEEELGFKIERSRIKYRQIGPAVVTDFDFVDDIALLSEGIQQAQERLKQIEISVGKVRPRMAQTFGNQLTSVI